MYKKRASILFFVILSSAIYFLNNSKDHYKKFTTNPSSPVQSDLNLNGVLETSTKASGLVNSKIKNEQNLRDELLKDYATKLKKLNQTVKSEQISPKKLFTHLIDAKSPKELEKKINTLPVNLQQPVREFHQAISELQKFDLQQDGKEFADLKPIAVIKPNWIKNRESEIKKIKVNEEAKKIVEGMLSQASLSNEDIEDILDACHKKRDCVESSIVKLIDSNFLLTDTQFKLINDQVN